MANKKARTSASAFQTIDLTTLDTISGGRIIPKQGPDPAVTAGISELVKAVGAIGQTMDAKQQAGSQQMMQMMQQMMSMKKGR